MMYRKSLFVVGCLLLLGAPLKATALANVQQNPLKEIVLCDGIAQPNSLQFDVSLRDSGISQDTFNSVLDKMEKLYADEVKSHGGVLKINRLWTDATVNASSTRWGRTWKLNMYGGMARHPLMTRDGFALVACHEMGHQVGGAPHIFFLWAANEGEADYYGTLKCLRRVFADEDNEAAVATQNIDTFARSECEQEFSDRNEQMICMRSAAAGLVLADVLQGINHEKTSPAFSTPDKHKTFIMNDGHPPAQCRLDTYFNGARCPVSVNESVSATNYKRGTCDAAGINTGSRPRCWFKPWSEVFPAWPPVN